MGACLGNEAQKIEPTPDATPQEQKILLLGAGCSGKSTLFRQLSTLFGPGYSKEQRMHFVKHVHQNIIQIAQILTDESEWHEETEIVDRELHEFIENIEVTDSMTPETAEMIHKLWNSKEIKYLMNNITDYEQEFNLPDSTHYYMEKVLEVAREDYVPTDEDILRVRIRTTGMKELKFTIEEKDYKVVDVGGQRNERKKWCQQFNDVWGIIFVASLGSYDQLLFEDETTNRLREALFVFKKIVNTQVFSQTRFCLFLNKMDIFKKKIQQTPLSKHWPEYEGPVQDPDAAKEFIANEFNRVYKKKMSTFFITAVDSDIVRKNFQEATTYMSEEVKLEMEMS